jgi:hypothetical protein
MPTRTGQCLCGSVRYTIGAEPVAARICWCRDCQHIASNGTVNILVPSDSLEVTGPLTEYLSVAASGNRMRRRFCPACGSHLFANSSGRPQLTVVRAGTLDDTAGIRPTANIWCASAPGWACMDEELERVEGQPGAAPPAR